MSEALAYLEKVARHLMVAKYITWCTGALVVYDYFLILDDEIAYVWAEKKSWISCLFLVNRYLLLVYAIFSEHVNVYYQQSKCARNIVFVSVLAMFFLLSSDVFITIRVYAVSARNKFIGLYLSSLICAKAITGYYFISRLRADTGMLPDIPIDAFRTCIASGSIKIQISAHAIGAVFDVSAFSFIIWVAYSNAVVIRFPSLLRTVVADATVYFIIAMGLQTLVLLFLSFADASINQFPLVLHSVVTPTLINRVVLSLKKTAGANSRVIQPWSTGHFTSIRFEPRSMVGSSETGGQLLDDPTEARMDTDDQDDIPLGEFIQYGIAY